MQNTKESSTVLTRRGVIVCQKVAMSKLGVASPQVATNYLKVAIFIGRRFPGTKYQFYQMKFVGAMPSYKDFELDLHNFEAYTVEAVPKKPKKP